MNNINIELDDKLFAALSLKAHEVDVTLSEYIKGRLTAEPLEGRKAVTDTVSETTEVLPTETIEEVPTETIEEVPSTLTRPPMPVKVVDEMPSGGDLEPPQQRQKGAPLHCEKSTNSWL